MLCPLQQREDTTSVIRKHKFFSGYGGDLCVEELDATVRLQAKKKEWVREVRERP